MFLFHVSLMANFTEHTNILAVKHGLLEGNVALI